MAYKWNLNLSRGFPVEATHIKTLLYVFVCVFYVSLGFQYNDVIIIGNSFFWNIWESLGTTPPFLPIPNVCKHNKNASTANTKPSH